MIYDYMIILDCREKEMIRFINETMEPDSFKIEPPTFRGRSYFGQNYY